MKSVVVLKDIDSGHRLTRTLAYPSEVQRFRNGVSVASPLGTEMLGKRVGQIIRWPRANGDRRLRIQTVIYQPEELRTATLRDTPNGLHGACDDFDHAYKAIRRIAWSFQDA
jgi:regulator of nucleoside diphosphate kinase